MADVFYFKIFPKSIYKTHPPSNNKKSPVKKIFISDWELKKKYFKNDTVIIPSNAILSPLSLEWIEYNNIKIIIQD